jgi:hypothetical protein
MSFIVAEGLSPYIGNFQFPRTTSKLTRVMGQKKQGSRGLLARGKTETELVLRPSKSALYGGVSCPFGQNMVQITLLFLVIAARNVAIQLGSVGR